MQNNNLRRLLIATDADEQKQIDYFASVVYTTDATVTFASVPFPSMQIL